MKDPDSPKKEFELEKPDCLHINGSTFIASRSEGVQEVVLGLTISEYEITEISAIDR
jgi:hypothetical protein